MNSLESVARSWAPRLLSVLRIVAGFLFLLHGGAKILHFPRVEAFDHVDLLSLGGLSGLLELFGGALLIIGLFTRTTAFILSGEMAAAYFIAHAPRGFLPIYNGGDAAVLYCFIYLYIAAAGPGPWSIDSAMHRRVETAPA